VLGAVPGPPLTRRVRWLSRNGRSDSAGLGVVRGSQSARGIGAGDDVDAQVLLDQVFQLGAADEGDPVALGEC
jgi:hypothetical protein